MSEKLDIVARATAQSELTTICEFIHDQRFDLGSLSFIPTVGTVRLPFEKEDRSRVVSVPWYHLLYSRWTVPVTECILEVRQVLGYSVDDPPKIGTYTFSTMRYDLGKGEIRIFSNEELQIIINVQALDTAVAVTGKDLGVHKILTVLGCEIS